MSTYIYMGMQDSDKTPGWYTNIVLDLYAENSFDTEATKIAAKLRENGKFIEKDVMDRGVNAQFKYANKIGAKYVVTIGDDELASGKVQLKNMESGETEEISISEIGDRI